MRKLLFALTISSCLPWLPVAADQLSDVSSLEASSSSNSHHHHHHHRCPTGPSGPTGPIGPTGPAQSSLQVYATFGNKSTPSVPGNGYLSFDQLGYPSELVTLEGAQDTIVISVPGIYVVSFGAAGNFMATGDDNWIDLELNGTDLQTFRVQVVNATSDGGFFGLLASLTTIVPVTATGTNLKVKNITHILPLNADGNIDAYVTLRRIDDIDEPESP